VVIDLVTWFAEEDMFRLRLELLGPLVDLFIVVEGDVTHTGEPKGWRFPDDLRGHPKVRWVPVTLSAGTPWGRENEQRRAMHTAAGEVADDADLVVFSDCDEIWDGRFLDGLVSVRAARMDFRLFSVFWRYQRDWAGSIGGVWGELKGRDFQELRHRRWELPSKPSGWHLSWMGDDESRRVKQGSFAHTEFADADVTAAAGAGRWLDGRQMTETVEGLPSGVTFPESWQRKRVT
jgi:hypothetical protein